MNRREILRYTAWITGSAISASLASVILSGCSAQSPAQDPAKNTGATSASGILHFFTPEQFTLVALLADTILPRTDSPSATDVNVHVTLDAMLGSVFDSNYQARFKTQWSALEAYLTRQEFSQALPAAQVATLQALELSQSHDAADAKKSLIDFKQHIIAYYLTTEVVAKTFLNYLPIPGAYKPCIALDEVNNKAWAL